MKKYRAKIDTPWFKKGTIYHEMPYGTYVPDRGEGRCYAIDHPEKWPDVFEPVEEKSPEEKWDFILSNKNWQRFEIDTVAKYLTQLGADPDKIYKEVCCG